MSNSVNSWSTVTTSNYDKKLEDTKKYGPHRVQLGLQVQKLLNNVNNLIWYLDGGNLLGAFRNGTMIAHDDDFDIGILCDNIQQFQALYKILKQKLNPKFKIRNIDSYCRKMEVYDESFGDYILDPVNNYNYHNVTVDLQLYLRADNGKVKMQYFKNNLADYIPLTQDVITPISQIKYQGHLFNAPHNHEKYLQTHYGYLDLGAVYNAQTRKYQKKKQQ